MNYTIQITSQKMMNDETRKGKYSNAAFSIYTKYWIVPNTILPFLQTIQLLRMLSYY